MATVLTEYFPPNADVGMTEEGGAWKTYACLALVSDLTTESTSGAERIEEALEALDGEGLSARSMLTGHDNLILARRIPRMIDKDKCEIRLEYEHLLDSGLQDLANPEAGKLLFRTEAGLESTETETYDVDGVQTTILVGYQFPDNHEKYPGLYKEQGGRINVQVPTRTLVLEGLWAMDDPDGLIDFVRGKVNADEWHGGAAGTWLVSRMEYVVWDLEPDTPVYKWSIQFDYCPDGWQPYVAFIDDETGKPPPDIVDYVDEDAGWSDPGGLKQIDYYQTLTFGVFFPDGGADENAEEPEE